MYINHDDVVQLATQSKLAIPSSNTENRNNDLLASMDREIVSLWSHVSSLLLHFVDASLSFNAKYFSLSRFMSRIMSRLFENCSLSIFLKIQTNKQKISWLKKENVEHVEDKEAKDQYNLYNRINARWASDELLLAVKGVRKYGKKWQVN